jgi:hypothetical protein
VLAIVLHVQVGKPLFVLAIVLHVQEQKVACQPGHAIQWPTQKGQNDNELQNTTQITKD